MLSLVLSKAKINNSLFKFGQLRYAVISEVFQILIEGEPVKMLPYFGAFGVVHFAV